MVLCEVCNKSFEKSVLGQSMCLSCMISPKRHRINDNFESNLDDLDLIPTESELEMEKICESCNLPYKPTGRNQKLCPACKDGSVIKANENVPVLKVTPPEPIHGYQPSIEHIASEVLNLSASLAVTLEFNDIIVIIKKK